MACPQGKRSPCRRSGQGAVGRPEWEGLRGLRVPDTLWRAAAGGPGHATGQAWSSTRFGRHRPLKTTASQRLPARSGAEAPGGGPGHQGRGECPRRAGSDPSRSTPRRSPAARAEPSWAGEVRALPSEDGPGSGVWQAGRGWGGSACAGGFAEDSERTDSRAQGGGRGARPRRCEAGGPGARWASAWRRRLLPGRGAYPARWVRAGSPEGWLRQQRDTRGPPCALGGGPARTQLCPL